MSLVVDWYCLIFQFHVPSWDKNIIYSTKLGLEKRISMIYYILWQQGTRDPYESIFFYNIFQKIITTSRRMIARWKCVKYKYVLASTKTTNVNKRKLFTTRKKKKWKNNKYISAEGKIVFYKDSLTRIKIEKENINYNITLI